MSTREEMESQSTETSLRATPAVEARIDVATAIDQLRNLVCGLGIGLLVVSLALTAFVYKQNRNLVAGMALHERQIARLEANEHSVDSLVKALVQYSSGKPELMGLLAKHGLQGAPTASSAQPPRP